MAITAAPFALKNLGLDAEPLRQAIASLVPNYGGVVQAGDYNVTQTTVASLAVQVGVGRVWMPGNNTSNLAGQTYSTQGQYFALNDAPFTVNLATANATNPRIDLIYVGTIDTQYGGASNAIVMDKITGTPAASPVAPTLPAGSNAIALATVAVAANATSVTNANITNIVVNPGVKHIEYVRTAQNDNPAGTLWGNGSYSALIDQNVSSNYSDMVDHPASNQVRFLQPGVYTITWKAVPNSTVTMWHAIFDGGGGGSVCHGRIPSQSVPGSDSVFAIAANLVITKAMIGTNSAIVTMLASIATANTAINWRLKITKTR